MSINGQLIVHRCCECGQTLPESYQPPADEDWTTGLCGCAEDRDSCKSSISLYLLPVNVLIFTFISCSGISCKSRPFALSALFVLDTDTKPHMMLVLEI